MEWRINFGSLVLMLILLGLQSVCSGKNIVYYIRPSSPQNVDCPSDHCCSLNVYGTNESKPHENYTVIMILIDGNHSTNGDVYNFGSPNNSHTVHVRGGSQSS